MKCLFKHVTGTGQCALIDSLRFTIFQVFGGGKAISSMKIWFINGVDNVN